MPKRVDLPIPFQLAASWSPTLDRDLTKWLVSEKLDGIRAMWDGRGNLLSRNGHILKCPKSFTESLPRGLVLDGELWIDRNMFEDVVSVVRNRPDNWNLINYKIFDVYSKSFSSIPYRTRVGELAGILGSSQPPFISVHPCEPICNSSTIIRDRLGTILGQGGEGLILRDPDALYSPGRKSPRISPILKVKPFFDAEAEVIQVNLFPGRKGSILVRDVFGNFFRIGSGLRDISQEPPPAVGSIITYAYTSRNQSTGTPRFPRYIRQRLDYDLT